MTKKKAVAKKKPLTIKEKKTLMDTMLTYKEDKRKIEAARRRLVAREERLEKKLSKICGVLAEDIILNKKDIYLPIFYKGKNFKIYKNGSTWESGYQVAAYTVSIQEVNIV